MDAAGERRDNILGGWPKSEGAQTVQTQAHEDAGAVAKATGEERRRDRVDEVYEGER